MVDKIMVPKFKSSHKYLVPVDSYLVPSLATSLVPQRKKSLSSGPKTAHTPPWVHKNPSGVSSGPTDLT